VTPTDELKTLEQARFMLMTTSLFMYSPDKMAVVERALKAEAQRIQVQPAFELHADGRLSFNGKMLPKDGKGLALAWMVLACEQYRVATPLAADVSSARRPWVTTKAMFNRAAQQVERTSTDLASAIRAIGTERGQFVLKHPVRGVRCTSPALARVFTPR